MVGDVLDSRDWVLRLLVRRQLLRLRLGDPCGAASKRGAAARVRVEKKVQACSLAVLVAMAEQLCASGIQPSPAAEAARPSPSRARVSVAAEGA
jgi:hypothetical protein